MVESRITLVLLQYKAQTTTWEVSKWLVRYWDTETTDQTRRRNDKLSRLPSRNIPSTSPDPQLPSRSHYLHHASPRCIGRYQHSDPIPYLRMCIGPCGPASLPDAWPACSQSRLLDEHGWRIRPILRILCDFILHMTITHMFTCMNYCLHYLFFIVVKTFIVL